MILSNQQIKRRKVLYISGTRADYGLMRHPLFCIKSNRNLEIEIVATGMHLMPEFGSTVKEIEKDKFKVHRIDIVYSHDNKESMAIFLGRFVQGLTVKISEIKPDIILLLGDRAEMLGGAIVGVYLTIPVVHVHGGEVSSTVDEFARHAITKLSHLHLVATKKSGQRIIRMGEESWRVRQVGAPGLDSIRHEEVIPKRELYKKFNLTLTEPFLVLIQHPNTFELTEVRKQINETLEAIASLKYQTIVIYPNADAGGRGIIKEIGKYEHLPFIRTFRSLPYKDYVNLLRHASVLVGNSSSGIIEAPYFKLPVINIGTRQDGRERAGNIIDVPYRRNKIITAIRKALCDEGFKEEVRRCQNPYGQGRAGGKIADILERIKLDQRLLQKRMIY
jgi:GDP/UDP-N,N'-diacetylbacillosamine 2-epimerase (hydrolysing)